MVTNKEITEENKKEPQVLTLPAPAMPETITVNLDEGERESLVVLLKEIILNLPLDPENGEEFYSSHVPTEQGQFKLSLYGFEMRALRTLFSKVR